MRQTSINAYHTIKENGLLSKRRWEVYDALFECKPATAMGVFNQLTKNRGNKVAANVYARLSELRNLGVVKENGYVVCKFTGMKVIEWDVTDNLPIKYEKPKKYKCESCKGRGYIIEQQAKLL